MEIKTSKTTQSPAKTAISSNESLTNSTSCCNSQKTSNRAPEQRDQEPSQIKLSMTTTAASAKKGCCMGTTSGETPNANATVPSTHNYTAASAPVGTQAKPELKKGPKTRVVIKYDVGFNNSLSLRGKGANLSWNAATPLKNVKNDEWVWETEISFNTCEFKVLINDSQYEIGENHPISCGASLHYTPKF